MREIQHGVDAAFAQPLAHRAGGHGQLPPGRGRVGGQQVRHAGDQRCGYGTHSTTAFPVAITVP